MELGEVLISIDDARAQESFGGLEPPGSRDQGQIEIGSEPRVLRAAGSDDLERANHAGASQPARFARCQRILQEGGWPWELLDVEPLLDGRTTVLHYLGPRHLKDATMLAQFRIACEFDVVFEPVASELDETESVELGEDHGCGSGCGSGGCGSGGGCGVAASSGARDSASSTATASGGGSHAAHAGCESCGISRLMASRRR
jgi:hypothetical protein